MLEEGIASRIILMVRSFSENTYYEAYFQSLEWRPRERWWQFVWNRKSHCSAQLIVVLMPWDGHWRYLLSQIEQCCALVSYYHLIVLSYCWLGLTLWFSSSSLRWPKRRWPLFWLMVTPKWQVLPCLMDCPVLWCSSLRMILREEHHNTGLWRKCHRSCSIKISYHVYRNVEKLKIELDKKREWR